MLSKTILLVTLLASSATAWPLSGAEDRVAPLFSPGDSGEIIKDQYIVVFKKDLATHKAQEHHSCMASFIQEEEASLRKRGLFDNLISRIKHTYDFNSFKGYAGRFSQDMLEKIRASDEVAYIEHDQMVYASEIQRNAEWGLSRISHRDPLTFGTFNKYQYDVRGGSGVNVYIIDTGIFTKHIDFEGRAVWGATIPDGDEDVDGNGHGTHVAGTVAGKRYGVSKKAKVIAVKVLRSNGSGTMSDVIKGVEWAINAHKGDVAEAQKQGKPHKGSVANMSLGGGKSRTLDTVVDAAVDSGIHFAVAAGNDNRDACDYSPAASQKSVTVGATTIEDERAWFSNHGKCVDVFAPGKDIKSTWITSRVSTYVASGTSMASPHVAGLLAYFLALQPDSQSEFYTGPTTPKQLKDKVIALSTKGILEKIPKGTVNLLVFNDAEKGKIWQ